MRKPKLITQPNFIRETYWPANVDYKKYFAPGSYRTISRGLYRVVVACPKGHWEGNTCDVSQVTMSLLHPRTSQNIAKLKKIQKYYNSGGPEEIRKKIQRRKSSIRRIDAMIGRRNVGALSGIKDYFASLSKSQILASIGVGALAVYTICKLKKATNVSGIGNSGLIPDDPRYKPWGDEQPSMRGIGEASTTGYSSFPQKEQFRETNAAGILSQDTFINDGTDPTTGMSMNEYKTKKHATSGGVGDIDNNLKIKAKFDRDMREKQKSALMGEFAIFDDIAEKREAKLKKEKKEKELRKGIRDEFTIFDDLEASRVDMDAPITEDEMANQDIEDILNIADSRQYNESAEFDPMEATTGKVNVKDPSKQFKVQGANSVERVFADMERANPYKLPTNGQSVQEQFKVEGGDELAKEIEDILGETQ